MFNKEKRQQDKERREVVKKELQHQIRPRQTFEQIRENKARRARKEERVQERETVVNTHLQALHTGQTEERPIPNIGSALLYLDGLSNIQFQINDQLSKADKCYTRWTIYGRHDKEFLGIAPTNRDVSFSGVTISFLDPKAITLSQELHYWDMVALLQQLQAA